jgi:hypothetical protein
VIFNLGVLAFFKYANFLIGKLNLAAPCGRQPCLAIAPLDILLPVGISFYTFQSMSYTIDVYRGTAAPSAAACSTTRCSSRSSRSWSPGRSCGERVLQRARHPASSGERSVAR